METGRNNLLEALKQVERRTENSARGWRLLLYGTILIPVFLVAPTILFGSTLVPEEVAPLVWVFLGFSFLLLAFATFYGWDTRRQITHALLGSSIAERIASGVLFNDPIFELTPWPWRNLLPKNAVRKPTESVLLRVAWNLDWYLNPPRRLWRWLWLLPPITGLGALWAGVSLGNGVGYALGYFKAFHFHPWAQVIEGLGVGLLLLLPHAFFQYRRQIWTEELVRHLRERLQA